MCAIFWYLTEGCEPLIVGHSSFTSGTQQQWLSQIGVCAAHISSATAQYKCNNYFYSTKQQQQGKETRSVVYTIANTEAATPLCN